MLVDLKIGDKKDLKEGVLLVHNGKEFVPITQKELQNILQKDCQNFAKLTLEQYNMDKRFEQLERRLEKRINNFVKAFVGEDDSDG